jgi:hypothetical protein
MNCEVSRQWTYNSFLVFRPLHPERAKITLAQCASLTLRNYSFLR